MAAGTEGLDERLLLLHDDDDCVVARVAIPAGARVEVEGITVQLEADLPVGHKLTRWPLEADQQVRKCGAVIGRTTTALPAGAYLHVHNLASGYLPAHLVGGESVASPSPRAAEPGRAGRPPDAPPDRPRPRTRVRVPHADGPHDADDAETAPLPQLEGLLRADGRIGIRNHLLVVYTVECAHHVVSRIAGPYGASDADSVQVVGFPGCYPNAYAERVLGALCTHPNVGGALVVSLGCESLDAQSLLEVVRASGRWGERLVIQDDGGTTATIARGRDLVASGLEAIAHVERVPMALGDLVVGTICGGSDSTSVLTANPAVGRAFDRLVEAGATCIFEETGELIGCEESLRGRGVDGAVGDELAARVVKAATYYGELGHASIAPGNLVGGLSTIEEKSVGAYAKSGSAPISGVLEPGERASGSGLYLLDVVPDGPARFGYPNINDTTEIVELIACGAHVIVFTTGRGSVVGSVVSPVLKICANPETYAKMSDDMDVNAGRILAGEATLDEIGREIYGAVVETASGTATRSEALGHQEFQLGYKVFSSLEPSCLA